MRAPRGDSSGGSDSDCFDAGRGQNGNHLGQFVVILAPKHPVKPLVFVGGSQVLAKPGDHSGSLGAGWEGWVSNPALNPLRTSFCKVCWREGRRRGPGWKGRVLLLTLFLSFTDEGAVG